MTPRLPACFFSHTADVYTVTAATGAYTTLAQAALVCRLGVPSLRAAASAPDRAELAALRRLTWGPDYTMPAHAQIEVDGVRWTVVEGTVAAATYPPTGGVMHYSCDLVRAG